MTKKIITWAIIAVTLLFLESCSSSCNCAYADANTQNTIENVA
ncbi:MAG: hypothetical protein U0K53_02660 [Paludibacteraceae bacterium]|nr:hypothetical protein [Paludibacteraceae bacterium]